MMVFGKHREVSYCSLAHLSTQSAVGADAAAAIHGSWKQLL